MIGFLLYANSLSAPFLLDDRTAIVDNPQIRQLWPLTVPLSPPDDTPVARRPIVNLSFAVNYALGALDARGYRLLNIAIHVLAALALFGVVRRTLRLSKFPGLSDMHGMSFAWWAAVIWLVHPLQTEAVDYVTQRTESMMGLFYLLTLYFAIRAADAGGRTRSAVASVAACAAGMACKESMVTAPIMVVLYDRIFLFGSFKDAMRVRGRLYAGLAATWMVLGALMLTGERTTVGFGAGASAWTYLLNQCRMITRYLQLTVWPQSLVLDYGFPRAITFAEVLPAALLVGSLVIGSFAALVWRPRLGFLGAWFFITLAPTSSFIPIATEVGAERRMYLPMAAVAAGAVLAVWRLRSYLATRRTVGGLDFRRHLRWVAPMVLLVVCILLAARAVVRNGRYTSPLAIAQTIVDRYPHGRAHFFLGAELLAAGRRTEGLTHLRQSARDFAGARYALGTEFLADGKPTEAIAQLEEFIRLQPTHVNVLEARHMLGLALIRQQKFEAAAEQLELILRVAPARFDVRRLLADALFLNGDYGAAIVHYEELVRYRGDDPRAWNNYGLALAASSRLAEATRTFERAIAADPAFPNAHRNLAKALLQAGRITDAEAAARRATALAPDDAEAHDVLRRAVSLNR